MMNTRRHIAKHSSSARPVSEQYPRRGPVRCYDASDARIGNSAGSCGVPRSSTDSTRTSPYGTSTRRAASVPTRSDHTVCLRVGRAGLTSGNAAEFGIRASALLRHYRRLIPMAQEARKGATRLGLKRIRPQAAARSAPRESPSRGRASGRCHRNSAFS